MKRVRKAVFEEAFVLAALTFYAGALLPLLAREGLGARAVSATLIDLVQSLVFGVALLFTLLRWKTALRLVLREGVVGFLPLLAICSTAWSAVPNITLQRGISLAATTVFGVYLATRFSLHQQLRLLLATLAIVGVGSVGLVVAEPSLALHQDIYHGAWRGLFIHKNTLARIAALGSAMFFLWGLAGHRRPVSWSMSAGMVLLLLFAQSAAGLLVAASLFVLVFYFRSFQANQSRLPGVTVFSTFAVAILGIWALSNRELVLSSLGKDATLTGRTELWRLVGERVSERMLFGYGYQGFWAVGERYTLPIWRATGWNPVHSHNGFLDLWLDLGIFALAAMVVSMVVAARRFLRRVEGSRDVEDMWPLVFLSFLLLYNITESTLLEQNSIFWVMYVSLSLSVLKNHGRGAGKHVDPHPLMIPHAQRTGGADLPKPVATGFRNLHPGSG